MGNDMLMGRPPLIMSRKQRVKVDYAVCISWLNTAQIGGAESSLAGSADTTVAALRIAGPDIDQHVGWLAGVDINELQLQMHGHARHRLHDVGADMLLVDKVRPISIIRCQGAAGIGAEERRNRCILVILEAALIVALGRPLTKRCSIPAVEEVF